MAISKYHSQWAGQFFVATELTRRGYYVAFPLGNAPRKDVFVVSPTGQEFKVEVKTLQKPNFWVFSEPKLEANHFYFFVVLPLQEDKPPIAYILKCDEAHKLWHEYNTRMESTGRTYAPGFWGVNWTTPRQPQFEDRWGILPG